MNHWVIRLFFWGLCTLGGFSVSQVRPELVQQPVVGMAFGFGFGGVVVAFDLMLKGFSIRAFSAATAGIAIGTAMAWMIDRSGLFDFVDENIRWLIRLGLFLGFSYLGMIVSMRSNKEDFSLIVPYVRFASQTKPDTLLVLDTSAVIDGRIAGLVEADVVEGRLIVPRFVLHELQRVADSADPAKRARGQRGLDMLRQLQSSPRTDVKIHEGDFPEEPAVDAKLVLLAKTLGAKIVTNDANLVRVAVLQSVKSINLAELSSLLKTQILPGDEVELRITREGREKGQGIGYLSDGTMVVVTGAHLFIGRNARATITNLTQTGAGVIVFAQIAHPAELDGQPWNSKPSSPHSTPPKPTSSVAA
jgi:uncharacterized protein YacL